MLSKPQCCGAEIIYFRLRLQHQLLPYIATQNCTVTVVLYSVQEKCLTDSSFFILVSSKLTAVNIY